MELHNACIFGKVDIKKNILIVLHLFVLGQTPEVETTNSP